MNTRGRILASFVFLGLLGCSSPESQASPISAKAKDARRLRVDRRAFLAPMEMARGGRNGILQVRLKVRQDGTVADVSRVSGSAELWFNLRSAIPSLRFIPVASDDHGPWTVIMNFTSDATLSSGSGSPPHDLEAGKAQVENVLNMEVVDVKSDDTMGK